VRVVWLVLVVAVGCEKPRGITAPDAGPRPDASRPVDAAPPPPDASPVDAAAPDASPPVPDAAPRPVRKCAAARWRECKADDECEVVFDGCTGQDEAVNRGCLPAWKKDQEKRCSEMNWLGMARKLEARCVKGRCVARVVP
jgi:hypothetical protein